MSVYRKRRDELENQLNKGALWAITYGDLMSYLMIFFLILFSFSLGKTGRERSYRYEQSLQNIQRVFGGKIDQKSLERIKVKESEKMLEDRLKENRKLAEIMEIESNEQKMKLVLPEAILFGSGKAELKDKAKNILKPIVEELKTVPNEIAVEGHTDNVPIRGGYYSTNWELSMARAYVVINYMEELGVNPKRLSGIGYGEHRPVADNSTPEGRAKNRRIEISLIKYN